VQANAVVPAPAVEPMVEVPPSATTILVSEDDREQRIGMQMTLERWGYRVVVAGSPEKALIAVRSSRPPALVISDLRMPSRMNGVETIATIGEILGRRIPGIILTGDTGPDRLREAKQSGCVLLHKPFAPERLREEVTRAVRAIAPRAHEQAVS